MKIFRLATLILLLGALSVYGQEKDDTKSKLKDRVAIKVEYFGELVLHPGMTIGVEYTLSKYKFITFHWNNDLGGYWHRWNNTSIFLKSSIGSRFAMGPVFADLNVGIGYLHSFAAGTIYRRAPDSGVEKAHNWGHAHLMPNASFLLGWDGTSKGEHRWTVYLGPEVYLQYPYNHVFLPHIAVRIGFTYKFKQQ